MVESHQPHDPLPPHREFYLTMPDRIVRAGILNSDAVNQLSWAAEVFFRRLMSIVDDFGRYDGRASVVRAQLYALKIDRVSDSDIGKWMLETAEAGLVRQYTVQGKQFVEIVKFDQRLRARNSKWPGPPSSAVICQQPPTSADICCQTLTNASEAEASTESESEAEAESSASAVGSLAHIPSKAEFVGRFATDGIPVAYLEQKWAWFEGNNAWLDKHQKLKKYEILVRGWWLTDLHKWGKDSPQRSHQPSRTQPKVLNVRSE